MLNKKTIGLVICVLLLCTMLAGCGGQQANQQADEQLTDKGEETVTSVEVPQEIVAGLWRDVGGMAGGAHHHPSFTRVFETLVTIGFELEIIPQLATSWEVSDDGLTWTFYLREGVKFHDGTPFNAEAAKFALEMHNKRRPGHLGPIASIEAVDEHILRITLTEPFAPLLYELSRPLFSMASPAAFNEKGLIVKAIGTGPFKEEEWVPGEKLVLVRNEEYWGDKPKLERVTLKNIPDGATRVMALEAGEIDMIIGPGGVPPEHVKALEDNPAIKILTQPVARVHYLVLNNQKPPFDDVRVRQAIQYAIDQKSIVDHALGGFGVPLGSCIAPVVAEWFNPEIPLKYDVEKAKQLLNEAGWVDTDGDGVRDKNDEDLKVLLLIGRCWPAPTLAEVIMDQLQEIGISVEIRVLERGALKKAIRAGEHDMTISIHGLTLVDPHILYRSFHSKGDLNLRMGAFFKNPCVDELTELGMRTMDAEKRRQYYFEVQKIVADEVPVVPIFAEVLINAVRDNIRGYKPHPLFFVNWEDIYVCR